MKTSKWAILGIVFGIVLMVGAVLYYVFDYSATEAIDWDVTLVGKNNEQRTLSYKDIRHLPAQEGQGGFFTTVGVVNGPYEVKGVLLQDLCDLVGGVSEKDVVAVSATDGYSMVFDYDQLCGGIETYDPATIHEVTHETLMILLTYEQDGNSLPEGDGKPLRIAVVGDKPLLTEGHNWVKWVTKIEVIRLD